jgi:hypothetical protein
MSNLTVFGALAALAALLPLFLLGMVRPPEAGPLASPPTPSPCPAWCAGDHVLEGEHVGAVRTHTSAADGRDVAVQLRWDGAGLARLALAVTERPGHCEAVETELDLATAERLALDLLILARLARIGQEVDA